MAKKPLFGKAKEAVKAALKNHKKAKPADESANLADEESKTDNENEDETSKADKNEDKKELMGSLTRKVKKAVK